MGSANADSHISALVYLAAVPQTQPPAGGQQQLVVALRLESGVSPTSSSCQSAQEEEHVDGQVALGPGWDAAQGLAGSVGQRPDFAQPRIWVLRVVYPLSRNQNRRVTLCRWHQGYPEPMAVLANRIEVAVVGSDSDQSRHTLHIAMRRR